MLGRISVAVCTAFADHLQNAHTKVGSFAFASFVFLLRFFGGFFLTLRQNVPRHHDFLAKVCVQVNLPTLEAVDSPIFLREPNFAGLIALN
jgi:hypothetical protein